MGKNEVEIIVTAEDKASGTLKGITGALGGVGKVAGGLALGGIGALVGGFAIAGNAAIQMNSDLETSTLQFTTLMGDADKAEAHVKSLFDFAAKTPFETGPIIEASRQLQVFGGDALNTEENLTRVGDTAAAVGAPISDISFWVGRAYSAIQGGQPFGEAAQNLMQMGAVSPEVIQQMKDLQASGATADEVFAVLQGHMDGFTGAMEAQAGTWEGLKSTIMDNLNMAAANALKPFFDLVKEGMAGLASWLADPAVQAGIQTIANGFATLIQNVATFVTEQVIPFVTTHGQQLKEVLIAIGVALGAFMVIGTIIGLVTLLMNPITLIVAAVGLLAAAWTSNWGGIRDKTFEVIEFIRPYIEQAMIFIRTVVSNILTAIQTFWQQHGQAILNIATQFWNLIKGLIDGVVRQIKLIVELFQAAFEGDWYEFGQKLFELWENAWNTIIEFIGGLWDLILPFLTDLWNEFVDWFRYTDWKALAAWIINGIIAGIQAGVGAIADAIRGLIDSILHSFGGGSESSAMATGEAVGVALVNGIAQGISDGAGIVQSAMSAMLGTGDVALSGASIASSGGSGSEGSGTTVVNIDARGAGPGVADDLRSMIEQVMRDYGARADLRMRTT